MKIVNLWTHFIWKLSTYRHIYMKIVNISTHFMWKFWPNQSSRMTRVRFVFTQRAPHSSNCSGDTIVICLHETARVRIYKTTKIFPTSVWVTAFLFIKHATGVLPFHRRRRTGMEIWNHGCRSWPTTCAREQSCSHKSTPCVSLCGSRHSDTDP